MITIISQSYFSQAFTGQLLCSIFFIVIKKSCCCKFHIACFHETEWCSHSCHLKNNSSLPTHKTTPHISKKSVRFLILIIFEVTSSAKLKQFENIHISNEFLKKFYFPYNQRTYYYIFQRLQFLHHRWCMLIVSAHLHVLRSVLQLPSVHSSSHTPNRPKNKFL